MITMLFSILLTDEEAAPSSTGMGTSGGSTGMGTSGGGGGDTDIGQTAVTEPPE